MDTQFWTSRWRDNDIGFHQQSVHDLLQWYWPGLSVAPGASVLVPLAGKSLDMVWLAGQGHDVFGIELSELAVDAFFAERGLEAAEALPDWAVQGSHTLKIGGPYTLCCGDFFTLSARAAAHIAAVYDRASLVALPANMRQAYARQLMALTPRGAKVLLISLDYEAGQMTGPPFPVPPTHVEALFQNDARITLLEEREVIASHPHFKARGIASLREAAYVLERR